jgi:hypothetical protein
MKRKPLFATFGGRVCCYTAATHGVGPKAAAELDANEALRGLGCYTAIATMQRGVPLQRGRPDCSNLQQSRTAQACGKLQQTAYDIRLWQGQSQLKKCQNDARTPTLRLSVAHSGRSYEYERIKRASIPSLHVHDVLFGPRPFPRRRCVFAGHISQRSWPAFS